MIGIFVKKDGVQYRLDLFNDEQIDITFAQQDVTDISKVFTDYSQTFTIPASATNNKVFSYWFENDLDNGFDDSTKLDCIIELNGNPFRTGKLKLEKANIVNGKCRDYSISFYGNLVSLKDKFKEDKLINITEINNLIGFEYTEENVVDTVVNENTLDIGFPLISPRRAWNYGQGGADDISTLAGQIKYQELFPAVRVKKIFEALEQHYDITFEGDFLNDKRFTELFLYCKNSEFIKFDSSIYSVDLVSESGSAPGYNVDLINNSIYYTGPSTYTTWNTMDFSIATVEPSTKWTLYLYIDGVYESFIEGTGSLVYNLINETVPGLHPPQTLTYKFKSDGAILNASLVINVTENGPSGEESYSNNIQLNLFGAGVLPVNILMPDIKVADFFSGILKMFNLTCYSEDGGAFTIQPLSEWYADGSKVNITKFCETNWDINKTPSYKSFIFKYEKSESLLNNAFYENFQRYYGDLEYIPENPDKDGVEYKVELPFENLLHQKMPSTKLHVGYNINKDLRPYTPKPILLYKWGLIDEDSEFYLESVQRTSYNAFGQDLNKDSVYYSLNFRAEDSSLLNGVVENTLFLIYYQNYLRNIFNPKARVINIAGVFNYNTTVSLKLNDRVIIRDKAYIINKLQMNLNKNKFNIEIISDL